MSMSPGNSAASKPLEEGPQSLVLDNNTNVVTRHTTYDNLFAPSRDRQPWTALAGSSATESAPSGKAAAEINEFFNWTRSRDQW